MYITCPIIAEQRLVENATLLVVVQFKSSPLFATQDGQHGLSNKRLRSNWEVLVVEVVMRNEHISALEQFDIVLDVLQLKLLLDLPEQSKLCLYRVKPDNLSLQIFDVLFCFRHAPVQLIKFVVV